MDADELISKLQTLIGLELVLEKTAPMTQTWRVVSPNGVTIAVVMIVESEPGRWFVYHRSEFLPSLWSVVVDLHNIKE